MTTAGQKQATLKRHVQRFVDSTHPTDLLDKHKQAVAAAVVLKMWCNREYMDAVFTTLQQEVGRAIQEEQ